MKIPDPRKLKSGTWFLQMRLNGVSVSVTGSTRKECKDKAALIKSEHRAGVREIKRTESEPTLSELENRYIGKYRSVLSPSTIDGYVAIVRTRFLEYADQKIGSFDWQTMINAETEKCSPKSIKNAWSLVSAALRDAKYTVPDIVLPPVQTKTRPWLPSDDIKRFITAMHGSSFEIPALMGLLSLRRSEIMAVTWDKIDLDKRTIRVEGAVVKNDKGKFVYKEANKQDKSRRVVPIMIPELLTALKAIPEEERIGTVVKCHPNSIYKAVNTVCKREGLSLIGTHGLRHSFASLGHHVGVPEQEMQLIGGWNDAGTMHKIYEHIEAADILKAQNAMADFYTNSKENAN